MSSINTNDLNRDRVEYIDAAKAIGIFCVLVGHTVASDTLIKTIIYAFHMPLFFFVSGMVYMPKINSVILWNRILYKAKNLMLPYIIWGCIYSAFSFKNFAFIMYGSRETLIKAQSLTSLWFLPVMFTVTLLGEGIIRYATEKKHTKHLIVIGCIIALCLGCLLPHLDEYGDLWGIDVAFVALVFFLLGYLLRKPLDSIAGFGITKKSVLFVGFIAILAFAVILNSPSEGYVLMANGIYGNIILFILGALAGTAAVIVLATLLLRIGFCKQAVLYVGKNTIGIFLTHKPFVELGRKIITRIGLDYSNLILAALNTLLWLIVITVIVFMINNVMPELFGKKRTANAKF